MSSPIYESLRAAIRESDAEQVSADEILKALGPRAFGLAIMAIMAPVCLPMPPGVPTVMGVILSVFAVQMILGYRTPWLPQWVRRKEMGRQKFIAAIDALERRLKFIERIARPRLEFLTMGWGRRLIGFIFLALGIILIIPFPFLGNLPPAIAASILALALAQKDGVLALIGMAASAAAAAFTWKLGAWTAGWLDGWLNG
jgi:hypothetical protein